MDMMLGGNNSNSIERKLEIVLNHSLGQGDTEAILTYKIPSQQIETKNICCIIKTLRSYRPLESMEMLSEELNLKLSQVKDSLMNILQVQITRMIKFAINDRVIPEIQNAMGTLTSGQRDTESGSSPNNQEDREGSNGLKTKITKKDSRSAFDLRDTEDLSPYTKVLLGIQISQNYLEQVVQAYIKDFALFVSCDGCRLAVLLFIQIENIPLLFCQTIDVGGCLISFQIHTSRIYKKMQSRIA